MVTLSGTNTVAIYNRRTNVFFIGSNGYLTMNAGDTALSESFLAHFNLPRVSACFDDLNPSTGGTVSWKQTTNCVAVTFANVREFGTTATVSFQIEMFYDGRIRLTCLGIGITDGLAGLSAGQGVPAGFTESDLSSYGACAPPDWLVVTPADGAQLAGLRGRAVHALGHELCFEQHSHEFAGLVRDGLGELARIVGVQRPVGGLGQYKHCRGHQQSGQRAGARSV